MTALEQLAGRMPALALARHPLGLAPARAAEFTSQVLATGDAGGALEKLGPDPKVARAIREARPSDAVAVLLTLIPVLGEVATLRRALAAAASYPLTLLASTAIAGWAIYAVSIPALVTLGGKPGAMRGAEAMTVLLAVALLLLLSAISAGGMRVPGFSRGHVLLDRALVLEAAAVLVEAQVPLDRAIAASAAAAGGAVEASARRLAHAFSSGATAVPAGALLDAEAAALLGASAHRGVAAPVLRALAGQALLEAHRDVPAQIRRVHGVALALAGVAVLALAVGWYTTYLHAVID